MCFCCDRAIAFDVKMCPCFHMGQVYLGNQKNRAGFALWKVAAGAVTERDSTAFFFPAGYPRRGRRRAVLVQVPRHSSRDDLVLRAKFTNPLSIWGRLSEDEDCWDCRRNLSQAGSAQGVGSVHGGTARAMAETAAYPAPHISLGNLELSLCRDVHQTEAVTCRRRTRLFLSARGDKDCDFNFRRRQVFGSEPLATC